MEAAQTVLTKATMALNYAKTPKLCQAVVMVGMLRSPTPMRYKSQPMAAYNHMDISVEALQVPGKTTNKGVPQWVKDGGWQFPEPVLADALFEGLPP